MDGWCFSPGPPRCQLVEARSGFYVLAVSPYESAKADPPDVSIVIPVYDERDNLEPLVAEIAAAMAGGGRPYEVVAVDDGSTDGSLEALKALKRTHPELHIVSFAANAGQTAAFAAGFRAARGAVIVTMDADGQNDPADVPALLEALERGAATAVAGYRVRRHDSAWKRVQSRIANGVRNRLNHETIRDTGCSLKAFRAEALRELPLFTGMHRFLPTLVRMRGGTVTEVPVRHRPRRSGRTKYGMWNRVFRSLADAFAVRWMQRRQLRYRVSEEIP
jgi:glycosyltransferase involved in cell wall biosynthesis